MTPYSAFSSFQIASFKLSNPELVNDEISTKAMSGSLFSIFFNSFSSTRSIFDTANSLVLRGNIEYLVSVVGVERVLYGSDFPSFILPREEEIEKLK